MDWKDEMFKMLVAFECQAIHSLSNIKLAFQRNGMSFNADFKQYFLRLSNARLEDAYNHFEIDSQFQDGILNFSVRNMHETTSSNPHSDRFGLENKESIRKTDCIEIDDTSDEEATITNERQLLKISSIDSGRNIIQRPIGCVSTSANIHAESRIGSTVIRRRKTNVEKSSFDECGRGGYNNLTAAIAGEVVIPAANESDSGRSNDGKRKNAFGVGSVFVNKRTSSSALNNMAQNPTKIVNSSLNPQSFLREKPAASKEMKKRFQCKVCQYSSNYSWVIKRHMFTHTGEIPYRCDICRKGFLTMQQMKIHKVTHTNEIPFHCRGCFTDFSHNVEREAHEKVCKYRRYECHLCKKYVTSNILQFKMHMRSHSGEKPFRCEICMKRFTAKCSLNMHLNTVHTRNNP